MKNQKYPSFIRAIIWSKFTGYCHQSVIEGYRKMLSEPTDYKEWEEEDISLKLCEIMEDLPVIKSKKITVVPEFKLYGKNAISDDVKAKNTDRIDFRFSAWKFREQFRYFGEAKNLSLKNWTKQIGTNVSASYYRGRYIDTGIEKIISGAYSKIDAFLIGYVVNGNAQNNVVSLNKLIKERKLPPRIGLIGKQVPISGYSECYLSQNDKGGEVFELQHIFLEFDGKNSKVSMAEK